MFDAFYRRPRLLVLALGLIVVAGLSSFYVLPRMEDPNIAERIALVNTVFPGADAERVESLVTEKLEEELEEIEEIRELRSFSRPGISTISVRLQPYVRRDQVDEVWSRVRDKLTDAEPNLPPGVLKPRFDRVRTKAYATIVALVWELPGDPNYAILRRETEEMKSVLRAVPGTEDIDTFGDPEEEIRVTIDQAQLAMLGMTTRDLSRQIIASDAKVAAGAFRAGKEQLLLEVEGELDSLQRVARTPIHFGAQGQLVQLDDVAEVTKGITDPPSSLALIGGRPAIALGAVVLNSKRIDHWATASNAALERFRERLPRGVAMVKVFEQNDYVATRLSNLFLNLLMGGVAVVGVILVMMGWRDALIVGSALPLTSLMVLTGMRILEVPMHQMSITGLIIALGLLIDNAIVVVDEVGGKLKEGRSPSDAVSSSGRHLAIPLFGSTLTTALAFAPLALMPGPTGEFVGSIAISVVLAIFSSLFLAMTIIPALTAWTYPTSHGGLAKGWWRTGLEWPVAARWYRKTLTLFYRRPLLGIVVSLTLPIVGFANARHLPEQFFPQSDRDQFQVELELPSQTPLTQTVETVLAIREKLLDHPQITQVDWFLGRSALSFYYNVIPRKFGTSHFAQAMVTLKSAEGTDKLVREMQETIDRSFPQARTLLRKLEQGPPFDAPIEVRLFGPDVETLRDLGDRVRQLLAGIPNVVHTKSDLGETMPKLSLKVDEDEARLAGLDNTAIASQLESTLEGAVGGSIFEATEELPVRVRVSDAERADLDRIASLDLMSRTPSRAGRGRVPLAALANFELVPEIAVMPRLNRRRMNEVKAYLKAGVLPSTVLANFREAMRREGFTLPPGYQLAFGGEADERDDAVGNLMASVGVLVMLMAATLVLTFQSFRLAGLVGVVAVLSIGLGLGALWQFGYPFGFMAIIGTMGLAGVAINDAIVVLAAIREDGAARTGDVEAMVGVVAHSTRHIVATSLTTMVGFLPLILDGGMFWPPLAVSIAGGVGGATILALILVPATYVLLMGCRRPVEATAREVADDAAAVSSTSPRLLGAT
ncbi:Nickel and cobalt resistance protein CnrA [Planctomycetes bacterium Pan216]|uniref:Nickel and cobalt resistance protein CnrA n=1 Tax=Kolteria novifilia TaxID=2527975 RepID=A0A518B1C8_9BACT|nr:Nickel and cobalt resistance protein CnrA [Planctomycetes bacterium Pan216]